MQFDLRKFITAGARPYHAEFQCDLSAYDYAGARIPQPVTAVFDAQTDAPVDTRLAILKSLLNR